MIVEKLKLINFRNYENQEIDFDKKINIIYGNNAQGKTNILEAIYMFSLGKSYRAYHDSDIIRFGESFLRAEMDFLSFGRENSAAISISGGKRKQILLNEIPVKKISEIVGKFNVVYFGPEYLSLIKDGPKKRRRNLDIMISQLRPGYIGALSDYRKLIEQKNSLLKSEKIDEVFLSIINEKVIELCAYIIKLRFEYIKKTEKIAKEIQLDISGGRENLEMNYISCGMRIGFDEEENIKNLLINKSKSAFEREKWQREASFGVHRDDVEFKINQKEIKAFGSQGQQKTAVLVQKIAEVELFKSEMGEYPVLLLDDIMSELDFKRQDYIINKIDNMQIFITCTDREKFETLEKGKFIEIEKGRVKSCTCI